MSKDQETIESFEAMELEYTEETRALLTIASALNNIAYQLKCLGVGNAATEMGAIELLAKEVKDGFAALASSVYISGDTE